MIGLEIETRIPISFQGEVIEEYPTIAEHRDELYHIDVDHSNGVSILEFVMDAFDEHASTLQDAYNELDRRLELIEALITAANTAEKETEAQTLFAQHNVDMTMLLEARLNTLPMEDDRRLKGPIHFTIGFAPRVITRLIADRLIDPIYAKAGTASQRAMQATALALPAFSPNLDQDRLTGYLALMYMQVAAAMDGVKDNKNESRGRLTKNRTQALCRVPFRLIYDDLPEAEQDWLRANKNDILVAMQMTFSGRAGTWGGKHQKRKELIPTPAKKLINGGFGEGFDNPIKTFGEMTVVPQGERVGPPAGNLKGYALELRRQVIVEGDPANRKQVARSLIDYSRQVHGT